MRLIAFLGLCVTCVSVLACDALAEDWPQWRGPRGDGTWNGPELARRWPADGLKQVWKRPVGPAYSGIAVSGGRVYTLDYDSERKRERVLCLDASTGRTLWTHDYAAPYEKLSYGKGPRSTPTVHDGRVYTLGAVGHFHCLEAATGKVLWRHDLERDFQARRPTWGFAASPVIDGRRVIVHAALGQRGCYAAFDRLTGKLIWKGGTDAAGYSTPVLVEHANVRRLIGWTPDHIVSHSPETGKLHWRYPYKVTYGVSIAKPIVHEGIVLVCGYWEGSRALKLLDDPEKVSLLWREERDIRGLMAQPLYRDGHVYLVDRHQGVICFELKTGKVLWSDKHKITPRGRNPQATLVWLGDTNRAIVLNSEGELIQVELSPKGYEELARTKIVGKTWAHPAYAGRHVFARDDSQIVCYELPLAAE